MVSGGDGKDSGSGPSNRDAAPESEPVGPAKKEQASVDTGRSVAMDSMGGQTSADFGEDFNEESIEEHSLYVGPHPPASELRELRNVYEDAPRLIFEQFTKEPEHRRELERMAIEAGLRRADRAQIFAFLFAVSMILLAAFAVYMNQPWVAGVLGVGTLASVVSAFLSDGQNSAKGKARSQPPNNDGSEA